MICRPTELIQQMQQQLQYLHDLLQQQQEQKQPQQPLLEHYELLDIRGSIREIFEKEDLLKELYEKMKMHQQIAQCIGNNEDGKNTQRNYSKLKLEIEEDKKRLRQLVKVKL